MNNWIYKGKEITSMDDMPDDVFGFIYRVTHKPSGRKYLGRKQLIFTRKRKIGKRETEERKQKKKEAGEDNWWIVKKYKYVDKESDWKSYVGSSDEMLKLLEKDGLESFDREILEFAYHKKQLTYKETRLLFENRVLEDQSYVNSNIQGKFYPTDVLDETQ